MLELSTKQSVFCGQTWTVIPGTTSKGFCRLEDNFSWMWANDLSVLLQGSREIYWLFVSIHASLEVWCSEIEKSPSVRKVIFQPSKFDKGLCKFAGMYLLYPFLLPRKDMEEIAGCPRKERVAFLGPRTFSDLVYPSQSSQGRLPDSIKSINSTNQVNQCSLVGTSLEPIPKTSSFLLEQFRQTTRSQRNSLLVKW